jgi:hypothetical protein
MAASARVRLHALLVGVTAGVAAIDVAAADRAGDGAVTDVVIALEG